MEDIFIFVIVIVLISCGSGVINNYLKTKRQLADSMPDDDVYTEVEELRARVEVLETIVTDEKYQLQRDLDQLERTA
jgi:hypothetical protein